MNESITKQDALTFIGQLEEAKNSIFNTKSTNEEVLASIFSHEKKSLIEKLCKDTSTELSNSQELKKVLDQLQAQTEKTPVVKISLAVEPTERFLKRVVDWCAQNIKEKVVLDIYRREKLIGGAVIEYKGLRLDYSVETYLKAVV